MKKFYVMVNPFTHNVIVSQKSKDGVDEAELRATDLMDSWISVTMGEILYDIHFYYDKEFSVFIYSDEEYQISHQVKLTIVHKDV